MAAALGLAAATALAAPPEGDFTVTPSTPNQGDSVRFRCEPCPRSTSVAWDLDGVGGFEASGRTETVTFSTAGPHTVRMRLTRDGETTIVTKTVTVNAPPTVTFAFDPDSPIAGQEVAFQPQVSDPEGNAVTLAWDFGDGTTGSGAAPKHAYAASGQYTVTVTASDSNGATGTASETIVVGSDPGPTASFDYAPTVPDVGDNVAFASTTKASQGSIVGVDWDLDDDGQFDDFSGPNAIWVFDSPGRHTVRVRAQQTNGMTTVSTQSVRVNGLPSADFTWHPASPVAGGSVDLTSTSSDFEGPLAALSWDLDGDGLFGDGSQPQIRQPFPEPGTYDIGLRVTDSDGRVSTIRKQVVVAAQPPPEPAPLTGSTEPSGGATELSPVRRTRFMSPFPIIRIAGTVLPNGSRISVLSVRAPRGSRIQVRCAGRGCPSRLMATTSATRLVRFHRFERMLRAGIRLKLFVRRENRIGKYTSFLIRAGAPPKRVDLCLFPTRRAPARCP